MADTVYILTNEAMPGLIKKQLYSTGVPLPFELFYACEVSNCVSVESKLHDAFGDHLGLQCAGDAGQPCRNGAQARAESSFA